MLTTVDYGMPLYNDDPVCAPSLRTARGRYCCYKYDCCFLLVSVVVKHGCVVTAGRPTSAPTSPEIAGGRGSSPRGEALDDARFNSSRTVPTALTELLSPTSRQRSLGRTGSWPRPAHALLSGSGGKSEPWEISAPSVRELLQPTGNADDRTLGWPRSRLRPAHAPHSSGRVETMSTDGLPLAKN